MTDRIREWLSDPKNVLELQRLRDEFARASAAVDVRNVMTGRPNLEG
jgi:hypothetical protein